MKRITAYADGQFVIIPSTSWNPTKRISCWAIYRIGKRITFLGVRATLAEAKRVGR